MRALIAICGSMAGQGPVIAWVALHRCHHQHSDEPGDPHSPWTNGNKRLNRLLGFWHAHFGWVNTYDMPDPRHYCPDLLRDKPIALINRQFCSGTLSVSSCPAL